MISRIKVAVSLTVELEPEEWDRIYGTGPDAAAVRKDVRAYLLNAAQQQSGIAESGAVVTLREQS